MPSPIARRRTPETRLFAKYKDVKLVITDGQQQREANLQIETAIRQKPALLIVAPTSARH